MKKSILFLLMLQVLWVSSQTYKGSVSDMKDEPLSGVNLYIDQTFMGATSDSLGNYSLTVDEELPEHPIVKIEKEGYENQSVDWSEFIANPTIILQEKEREDLLEEVVIKGSRFKAGGNTKAVFNQMDIYTGAGSMGDIVQFSQTVPGVQTVPTDGKLYIRGGNSSESKVFVDGMEVLEPYTQPVPNTPARSAISTDLINGISISTGGYSAEYGQSMSGGLFLETKPLEKYETESNFTLSTVGVWGGTTQKNDKQMFHIAGAIYNLTLSNWLNGSRQHFDLPTQVYTGTVAYNRLLKKGNIKYLANYAYTKFKVQQQFFDNPAFQQDFGGHNLYHHIVFNYDLGNRYKLYAGANYGFFAQDIDGVSSNTTTVNMQENKSQLKLKLNKKINNKLEFNVGIEQFINHYQQHYTDVNTHIDYNPSFNNPLTAVYTEMNMVLAKNLGLSAGLRYEYSNLLKESNLAPRLSLNYNFDSYHSLVAVYGKYFQTPTHNYLKYSSQLDFTNTDNYVLSYTYQKKLSILKIETYYKRYNDLVSYTVNQNNVPSFLTNNGKGYAQGIDVFWKDKKANFTYWLGYSFIDSKRKYDQFTTEVRPNFITQHSASISGSYWFDKLRTMLSISNSFTTGRPYDNLNIMGENESKTSSVFMTNVSVAHMIDSRKFIYVGINNIFNSEPTYGYIYNTVPNAQGMYDRDAILPNNKRNIFIGMFWTLGKQNAKEQIEKM